MTTAERLQECLTLRPRHRWRALLLDVLTDVDQGVDSPLERRYLRDVERRHGLPGAERNLPETSRGAIGVRRHRDIRYREFHLVVELDGREAHPLNEAFRDRRRDNGALVAGDAVLRYGWREIAVEPCAVAAEVVAVLFARGWRGRPRPCCSACPVLLVIP